eukprot:1715561-Pleurochrysis_carterae.AAC.6
MHYTMIQLRCCILWRGHESWPRCSTGGGAERAGDRADPVLCELYTELGRVLETTAAGGEGARPSVQAGSAAAGRGCMRSRDSGVRKLVPSSRRRECVCTWVRAVWCAVVLVSLRVSAVGQHHVAASAAVEEAPQQIAQAAGEEATEDVEGEAVGRRALQAIDAKREVGGEPGEQALWKGESVTSQTRVEKADGSHVTLASEAKRAFLPPITLRQRQFAQGRYAHVTRDEGVSAQSLRVADASHTTGTASCTLGTACAQLTPHGARGAPPRGGTQGAH